MRWTLGRARRRTADDARVRNHDRYRRASTVDAPTTHDYHVHCSLGGFGTIGIPWSGASLEDARDSFLVYITDHEQFYDVEDPRFARYRSLYVNFNGQLRILTFRTDWIAGFTVH